MWGNTLIDGHNRYSICQKHGIPFETMQKDFASRDDVMLWMIDTQFSRRNLDAPDRILLAQKKAPILERLAKQRQREYYGNQYDNRTVVQMDKSPSSETSFVQMDNNEKTEAESRENGEFENHSQLKTFVLFSSCNHLKELTINVKFQTSCTSHLQPLTADMIIYISISIEAHRKPERALKQHTVQFLSLFRNWKVRSKTLKYNNLHIELLYIQSFLFLSVFGRFTQHI